MDISMLHFFFLLMVGYLVGAIPTGAWVARIVGIGDITTKGSGNTGATNVGRLLGFQYFFLVLLIDILKAFCFMNRIVQHYTNIWKITLAGVALLLGNGFSCFLGGKGGKGVATSIGIMGVLQGLVLQYTVLAWMIIFAITRNVGIASVAGLLVLPVVTYCLAPIYSALTLFISLWGIWRHASNIKIFMRSLGYKNF